MFQFAFWHSEQVTKAEPETTATVHNGKFSASDGFWMKTLRAPIDFSRFHVKHESQKSVIKLSVLALLSTIRKALITTHQCNQVSKSRHCLAGAVEM